MAASILVGFSLQLLATEIRRAKDQAGKARTILKSLEATIVSVSPMIAQLEILSKALDTFPEDVMLRLDEQLKQAAGIVNASQDIGGRHFVTRHRYRKRLIVMDESLRHLVTIDIQVAQSVDLKNMLVKMTEMNKKLEKMGFDVSSLPAAAEGPPSNNHGHCKTCSCGQQSCSPKHRFEFCIKFQKK